MLGLNLNEERVSTGMITTSESLPGYEITCILGIVEGVSEVSFAAMSVGGLGLEKGGELDRLLEEAKEKLVLIAGAMGANAIVEFRYESMGRHVEKSAIA